jgi:hypothetical protein
VASSSDTQSNQDNDDCSLQSDGNNQDDDHPHGTLMEALEKKRKKLHTRLNSTS